MVVQRAWWREITRQKSVGKRRRLSRTELARRIITDYADQLRAIIKQLRRRLH
ncbi:hypothetical protein BF49_2181 [Bradyrhizobium sp.]|nr:hypothetical protein BF49_2181 [Bradyrhizobium sp.]